MGTYNGYTFVAGADRFSAAVGICDYTGDGSVRVEHNIVKNYAYAGIDLESDETGSPPSTTSSVKGNLIENLDYNADGYGMGIILYNNYYAEVADNCLTNVAVGMQAENYWVPNPADARGQKIAGNQFTASGVGIMFNLVY